MAWNWFASAFFLYLIARQDLFVEAGEYNSNCPDFSQALGDDCTVSSDCSTITCKLKFVEKDITLKVEINKCEEPVTITITIDVPDLGIDWSHTYKSGDIVKVPGFTASVPFIGSVGVYIQVDMTDNGDQLTLKVKLLGGGDIVGQELYPVKLTVLDGKLPISTKECGILRWWYNSSVVIKAVAIGGAVIILISLIACCYCCCCRTKPSRGGGVVVSTIPAPVAGVVTTNTSNAVHMQDYARFP